MSEDDFDPARTLIAGDFTVSPINEEAVRAIIIRFVPTALDLDTTTTEIILSRVKAQRLLAELRDALDGPDTVQ